MTKDYNTAISELAALLDDGWSVNLAKELADMIDLELSYDRANAVTEEHGKLWDALQAVVEVSGEAAMHAVDEAKLVAGCEDCEEG